MNRKPFLLAATVGAFVAQAAPAAASEPIVGIWHSATTGSEAQFRQVAPGSFTERIIRAGSGACDQALLGHDVAQASGSGLKYTGTVTYHASGTCQPTANQPAQFTIDHVNAARAQTLTICSAPPGMTVLNGCVFLTRDAPIAIARVGPAAIPIHHGRATVSVSCAAQASSECRGIIVFVHGGKAVLRGAFSGIAPGDSKRVTLHFTSRGAAYSRARHGRHATTVKVRVRNTGFSTTEATGSAIWHA